MLGKNYVTIKENCRMFLFLPLIIITLVLQCSSKSFMSERKKIENRHGLKKYKECDKCE